MVRIAVAFGLLLLAVAARVPAGDTKGWTDLFAAGLGRVEGAARRMARGGRR